MTEKIKGRFELIWKLAYAFGIIFLIYVVVPMENRLTHRIDKLEESNKIESREQFDRFFNYYDECKKEIASVRKEHQEDITRILEKLYVWLRTKRYNIQD